MTIMRTPAMVNRTSAHKRARPGRRGPVIGTSDSTDLNRRDYQPGALSIAPLAAGLAELRQSRGDERTGGDHLQVAELPHVEVDTAGRGPPDEDVRGALDEPLPGGQALAVGFVPARPGLLDPQEERIGAVTALLQLVQHR